MRGLRTQESKKFNRFFEIVQDFAEQKESVFFAESGEGNDITNELFEGEDLSGWLIPNSLADEFEKEFEQFDINEERWEEFECFANWEEVGGKIQITFDKMAVPILV